MPVGDSHLAFAEAAAQDGVALSTSARFDWLTEMGHLTLDDVAADPPASTTPEALGAAAESLEGIYRGLGGDLDVLTACRATYVLPLDLFHEPSGTMIEIDEAEHFTSFRLETLDAYPPDTPLGFDLDEYRELCREHAEKMDRFQKNLPAKGWGFGGLQRERAYRDALLDLAAPAMGHLPVVRIVAIDADGAAAYARNQDSLLDRLGAAR